MDLLCTENIILNDYESDLSQTTAVILEQNQCNGTCIKGQQHQYIQQQQQYSSNQQFVGSNRSCCSDSNSSSVGIVTETENAALDDICTKDVCSSSSSSSNAAETLCTNNLLTRNLDHVNSAVEDPTFLTDRILENALKSEEKHPTHCSYFQTVQKDITPPMRKIVAEWMMEVCAEQKCQEEVVLLALNYMDRFLSTKPVRKTQLQILAAACLLLASKLREPNCRALSAELLVFYTDNSIYKHDLIQWELFVLSRLQWDLSSVTPLDFLELLLIRLPIRSTKCPDLNLDKVKQHAQAFISLAAKEHYFSIYSASTIAASSIAAALSGLNWHLRSGRNLRYLLNRLTDLTSVEQDYLHDCMIKMETIFEEHSRNLQPYLVSIDAQPQHHQHNGNNSNSMLPDLTQTCKMQANTQKDIQDIKF